MLTYFDPDCKNILKCRRVHVTNHWLIPFACLFFLLFSCGFVKIAFAAEEETVYRDIYVFSSGEDVLAVQSRLMELDYYQEGNQLTPSLYDEGTQEAIRLFCETNHIAADGTELTASVQRILFSDGAKPYEAPEVKQSLSERFFLYMSGDTEMLGAEMPTYLVWVFSAILIVITLILAVHFFVPDLSHEQRAEKSKVAGQYWRPKQALKQTGDIVTQQRVHGGTSQKMDIQICYETEIQSIQCHCPPAVTIGRGNCVVRLNPSDLGASSAHCEIAFRGAVPIVRDHSSNGTYVNGNLLHHAECRLHSGDRLEIGAHELLVEF